jgi:cell division protease FtsH
VKLKILLVASIAFAWSMTVSAAQVEAKLVQAARLAQARAEVTRALLAPPQSDYKLGMRWFVHDDLANQFVRKGGELAFAALLAFVVFKVMDYFSHKFTKKHIRTVQRPTLRFADVAGAEQAKNELMTVVDLLKNPVRYQQLGAKLPRGILLYGPPGNGKTLLAQAVAGEANCAFIEISSSEFNEMYVGVGASRVRELFAQARKHTPAIIYIDEIDAIGSKRTHDGRDKEHDQTLNALLTEMDGFSSHEHQVFVIASTNRKDKLDDALIRSGRFDRLIEVALPNPEERRAILQIHAGKVLLDQAVDLAELANKARCFCGADLANLLNQAALHAVRKKEETISHATCIEMLETMLKERAERLHVPNLFLQKY